MGVERTPITLEWDIGTGKEVIGWWLVLLNKPKNSIEWNFESFQGRPGYSENLYRMVLSEPTKTNDFHIALQLLCTIL